MESSWLVLVSLALGLMVGAGFISLLQIAERHGRRASEVVNPAVPDGIDQVLDALDTAAVVLDPSNNVMKTSPAAVSMGMVWNRQIVHPELLELAGKVRRSGEPIAEDLILSRGPFGDASMRVRVRLATLGTRYVLLLAEDRTEAFRLDEVRRDFVANISHELKTPIAAVGLLAEALNQAADEPAQVRRFASRLTTESGRLTRLTQEIIELSRLQAQDSLSEPEDLPIDDVVAAAVDQSRVVADAARITLAVGQPSGALVTGDERLLVMAVHNLVANAVHYSAEGSRVGVGVRHHDGVVEVTVTDQGVGIQEADLDRIFERFFRVDQARSRHTGGTGLGLSIVKHIVQIHGGDIRVWSQPGSGSTFTIRLPEASHTALATTGETP
ncbi:MULTISPECIES: cell wall metabolism sensor histidine kinase WalK [Cryobacterium]|uniref:Sensor-like histidine kinase SenX3 n=1 Tax=Cryobacterium glucosi TaxID=1259175 RepID=A0ABY2INU7_9MICO|nr:MULTISPECIES: ATP-binding protein [Cryobacterium]MEB0002949.1 ATP-binding protein [Cryobacterium sp. RTC2.1]TFB98544.1 two-component sensor histidine kinase [Cryobacterium sp. MDB2-A-1]TFC08427.1 two-component sensor histidine kinase [Cryobacterium sp. MDB2-33-2]TFC08693.1 two-component sensor histidine kinase [Cryobacterium sp. MDB2-A-2]TFC20414.1 two-component sensor histidine kinase [Cryobacterium glucosi]